MISTLLHRLILTFIHSSYFQLLIHKSNLQSCLCQYVKDRRTLNIEHETLNSRGCQHTTWRITDSNR